MVSSRITSLDVRLDCFSDLSDGNGGGGDEFIPSGVTDLRDRRELLDGVLYGVSVGVGSDAAVALLNTSSGSVSHPAMASDYTPAGRAIEREELHIERTERVYDSRKTARSRNMDLGGALSMSLPIINCVDPCYSEPVGRCLSIMANT